MLVSRQAELCSHPPKETSKLVPPTCRTPCEISAANTRQYSFAHILWHVGDKGEENIAHSFFFILVYSLLCKAC